MSNAAHGKRIKCRLHSPDGGLAVFAPSAKLCNHWVIVDRDSIALANAGIITGKCAIIMSLFGGRAV